MKESTSASILKVEEQIKKKCIQYSIIIASVSAVIIIIYIVILFFTIKPEKYDFYNKHCSSGYFIPEDSIDKTCEKCSIEFCNICSGKKNNNSCKKCINSETAVYENNTIVECPMCLIGEGNNCKECNNDDLNKCQECNEGYNLTDGKCIESS